MRRLPGEVDGEVLGDVRRETVGAAGPVDDAERRLGVPRAPMSAPKLDAAHTEADLMRMLRARYSELSGNGPRHVFLPHVRSAAGFDATRTADALVMHLWPSDGLELHGFEIKVSRRDWLSELVRPEKSAPFREIVDRWWIVAPDVRIVRPQELPERWGLMVVRGARLCIKRGACLLREYDRTQDRPLSRSFIAAMLRAAARGEDAPETASSKTGPIV